MTINNNMKEQENNKDKQRPADINLVQVAVTDHLVIVDKETGEKLVDKRG